MSQNTDTAIVAANSTSGGVVISGYRLETAIEAFLRGLDCKEATKRQYRKALRLFSGWVSAQGLQPDSLGREDIVRYKDDLINGIHTHSPQTVSVYLTAIRRFYEWTESERIYPNIAGNVRSPRINKTFVKQHLTASECTEVLRTLEDHIDSKFRKCRFDNAEQVGLRDYAMVNLILRTGLRTIEVSRLDVSDITLRRGHRVISVWGKGRDGKDDYVPLSEKAYGPLKSYLSMRPDALPGDPLFVSEGYRNHGGRISTRRIQEIAKDVLREVGIDDHAYSAHSFRHTCAVLMLSAGVSIYDVQKFLRHSSTDTTDIYVKSIEDDLRLERSPEKILDNAF